MFIYLFSWNYKKEISRSLTVLKLQLQDDLLKAVVIMAISLLFFCPDRHALTKILRSQAWEVADYGLSGKY